jgi:hypothetical protein
VSPVDQPHSGQGTDPVGPEESGVGGNPDPNLPVYNRDFDDDYPPAGQAPKDAIDWASRMPTRTIATTKS